MAPVSIDNDFLDDALKNKTLLPSWRSIFTRITSPNTPSPTSVTQATIFLCSKYSLVALHNCHNPFPPPSVTSRQEFERRTAPINFTAADQHGGDGSGTIPSTLPPIAELKTAALDLSKTLNIDEISALRIVVQEHHNRPVKALLAAEAGAGGDATDLGASTFGASFLESIFRPKNADDRQQKDDRVFFDRVEIYLYERRYVSKVAAALLRAALGRNSVWYDAGQQLSSQLATMGWVGYAIDIVAGIRLRWFEVGSDDTGRPAWVRRRLQEPEVRDQVAYTWEKQTFMEIIHLQQLLFLLLYRPPPQPINGKLATEWFQLMEDVQFFDKKCRPRVSFPSHEEISKFYSYTTGPASIVSVAMLQIPTALAIIDEEFSGPLSPALSATPPATAPPSPQRTASGEDFYIRDASAIRAITNCMQACAGRTRASSLAVMGWAFLLGHMNQLSRNVPHWDDADGIAIQGTPIVEMWGQLLPGLFPTTVEVGLANLVGYPQMPASIVGLLDPTEAKPELSGFQLDAEEDSFRMKNVVADLVRKTQKLFDFSGSLIVATFLLHNVEYSNLSAYQKFLNDEPRPLDELPKLLEGSPYRNDWTGSPVEKFWQHEGTAKLLARAKNRFPHEPLPFLRLIRGLATHDMALLDYLARVPTYTEALPPAFKDFEDVETPEDDDTRYIRLEKDLRLFPARDGGMFKSDDQEDSFAALGGILIPQGTQGILISSGSTKQVVAWRYEYNALALFGRILEYAASCQAGEVVLVQAEIVTEIVSLFTMLIASSKESAAALAREPGSYDASRVLMEASEMLERTKDVISVVFDLLDSALNRHTTESPFLVVGVEFVDSLVHLTPGRVWAYLARSILLEWHGRGGAFAGYLSAVEVTLGSYDFTLSCLTLYASLVEEAIRSSATNKGWSKPPGFSSKAISHGPAGMGASDTVLREILLGFTRIVVDIFESYRSFRYTKDVAQKLRIGTLIARVFTKILYYVYGVDEFSDAEHKITSVLVPSAKYLVSVFLSTATSDLPIEPILGAISDGVQTPESSLYTQTLRIWVDQVINVVKFADMLARVRLYLGYDPSHLEEQLYAASASIAKLYAADERYKRHVLELFESLVKSSGSFVEVPPSLLGHLGVDCANHFVALLSDLDKPYQDEGIETRIWNLISAVVSNKQQGMTILLLQGKALRQGKSAGQVLGGRKKSMLAICFDVLDDIERLPVGKTLAMLEMVSTAQNFWNLAMDDIGKHPRLLSGLTKHVENFAIELLPADSKELITEKSCKLAIAAHIARILALYLHTRRPSQRDGQFFKQLLPRLNFYFEKAVKISGYRASLHVHLQKNLEGKWPGVKLAQLKKTRLRRTIYGVDAVYDLVLGDKVLGFDPGWAGRPDGYRCEVERANLNLSLVQTQVDLLSTWELLAVELCDFVDNSKELTDSLVSVVETCLQENVEAGLPTPIFTQILARRAEFAFVVVRKLHQALPDADLFTRVFAVALKAIHNSTTQFRQSLVTADMDYYRSLLRIIYISLNAAVKQQKHSQEFGILVVDLLDIVVAKGFKDLAQAAYQHPARANPQDIALVTGILQAALRLKDTTKIHYKLATHLHENQTIRAATTLFSWAEQLATNEEDPVYGELSVLFLLELSSVPVIAEQLALENILELLTSTTLAARIREGVTHLSHPRLHAIWYRGLLPLALNLLANIGIRYGREIIAFLKYFNPQIRVAMVDAWKSKQSTVVVLPAVNECVGIAMILAIIQKLGGKQELTRGVNLDTSTIIEGVDYFLTHRNYLKSLVSATSVEEEMTTGDSEEEGGLMERVVNGLLTLQGLLTDDAEE